MDFRSVAVVFWFCGLNSGHQQAHANREDIVVTISKSRSKLEPARLGAGTKGVVRLVTRSSPTPEFVPLSLPQASYAMAAYQG